ncbi:Peptidyl-prolyl cis-trans isomerase [Quillaja saponaria]|uniref:Peptidyl-prolyl cis-trans isomerase n=1 Tax=Quillaja saponaria TaxID=32244 RepID=A0AAD7QBP0_QUISA|nr:Peptidyl-prolyl cis-trans isomerase [Quillaja saponaria]
MATNQVRASHILIKHQGSRRKASWKDPEGHVISNTTKDSAVAQLHSLREDIITGKAKFDDVASRYSDCSSAKHGGDLGPFGRGQMQKPFEEATYALKIKGEWCQLPANQLMAIKQFWFVITRLLFFCLHMHMTILCLN